VDFAANKRALRVHQSPSLHRRKSDSRRRKGITLSRDVTIFSRSIKPSRFSRASGTNRGCIHGIIPFSVRACVKLCGHNLGKLGRVHEIGRYREIDPWPRQSGAVRKARNVLMKNAQRAVISLSFSTQTKRRNEFVYGQRPGGLATPAHEFSTLTDTKEGIYDTLRAPASPPIFEKRLRPFLPHARRARA